MISFMKVKICGIRTPEEAMSIANLNVDALGVVVGFDQTLAPDNIQVETARAIVEATKKLAHRIDIFLLTNTVDPHTNIRWAKAIKPSHIQLTADMSPEDVVKIKKSLPRLNIVKVIPVLNEEAILIAQAYEKTGSLQALLLDSKVIDYMTGASGKTHDWSISRKIVTNSRLPIWLAGGLRVTNLQSAIDTVGPYGVDVQQVCKMLIDQKIMILISNFYRNSSPELE
jgi:phosphoribosylanthranilate isomerase